jgi:hypothetical protein
MIFNWITHLLLLLRTIWKLKKNIIWLKKLAFWTTNWWQLGKSPNLQFIIISFLANTFKFQVVFELFCIIGIDFNCWDAIRLLFTYILADGPHTSPTHMLLNKLHKAFDIFLGFYILGVYFFSGSLCYNGYSSCFKNQATIPPQAIWICRVLMFLTYIYGLLCNGKGFVWFKFEIWQCIGFIHIHIS